MSDFSRARSQVAGVARRLDALLDESVAPLDALDILVAQQHLRATNRGVGPWWQRAGHTVRHLRRRAIRGVDR